MAAPLNDDIKELCRLAWFSISPPENRSAEKVRAILAQTGWRKIPSKGSITRWMPEWKATVETTADRMLPVVKGAIPTDLSDVPQALQDALGLRLLYVARGEGLDKVEDAIIQLSGAIASKAPQIAEMLLDTESETAEVTTSDETVTKKVVEKGKVARAAVSALTQLASAMQTITASRVMVSLAHRNFAEGDKLDAEATAIIETGRADNAKVISPAGGGHTGQSAEAEARAALEGTLAGRAGK